jgi:hypothetical protein
MAGGSSVVVVSASDAQTEDVSVLVAGGAGRGASASKTGGTLEETGHWIAGGGNWNLTSTRAGTRERTEY